MSERDVVRLLALLAEKGVRPWIDGGWGVDALLGRQTREHADLDMVIEDRDEAATVSVLEGEGFQAVPMWFTTPVHTVWRHEDGRVVDLHVVVLDDDGSGIYGDEGVYPADGLTGRGRIGGDDVRCISATAQVEFHRGYELRDQDRHDVGLLHAELGVPLPPEYR
ncbi:aminoglycoside nucleotidyltransferase [Georgenia sp. TF02-10]|uniref:nucleotidyltransferase domain-containing protein n=1 Tax=Georgenia sp. TF02-10 TaxID=2917725 RepID=UPI001FA79A1F|nr:aminoglycoside nucleotidyltransferase [Georgenia sp. TF02-10]UNX54861.1 aminoglycoside nucleotidyltransferase [Georgenia sp. TF02-10]